MSCSQLTRCEPLRRATCRATIDSKGGSVIGIRTSSLLAILVTPLYLWTQDPTLIVGGFILQGIFGGAIYGQNPSYLCERFPTEVRATASGFVYHQGAIWGGLVAPVVTYFAIEQNIDAMARVAKRVTQPVNPRRVAAEAVRRIKRGEVKEIERPTHREASCRGARQRM